MTRINTQDIPSSVSFSNGQSVTKHFKALTNYMDIQSKIHADRSFISYYSKNEFRNVSYSQMNHIATNMACKWANALKDIKVVSYIADHNIDYLIVLLAIMKLRITLMNVSPRNSEAAAVNLLEKTESKLFIANAKYQSIANSVSVQIPGVNVMILDPLDIDALLKEPFNYGCEKVLDTNFSDNDIEYAPLIIHSSGSTAFPKPIYLSNRYLFNLISCFHININSKENFRHINENDIFLSCTPLFHLFGVFTVFTTVSVGGKMVFLKSFPTSQDEIHRTLEFSKCTIICAPPIIYEQMISYLKEKNIFSTIKQIKVALCGGAHIKEEVGQWLLDHGLYIRNSYGLTEIGGSMISDFNPASTNWKSLTSYHKDLFGQFYNVFETYDINVPDIKHLYIRKGSPCLATGVSNRPDGGFNTNDLFRENPKYPGYYDYIGRRDDILIMENGEKTNPIPMEATIRQHKIVKQVVVIGQGRQCNSALIQADMDYAIYLTPEDIISEVQTAVKEANKECPSHSIILPQMIKILPFNKTLPSTDKGTIVRKRAEAEYKELVEKLYKDFLEGPSQQTSNTDISAWNIEDTKKFLINCASQVLGIPQSKLHNHSQSLFEHGLNSLLSIQLRNLIAERFDNVPQNFLFEHSSISSMSEVLMNKDQEDPVNQIEQRYQQTQKLAIEYLKKARHDFPIATNAYDSKKEKVIMLTGATGSLGSFMLCDLLKDPSVKKVYVVIRGKQDQLMNRLINTFKSRLLDTSILNTNRVEALPMLFHDPFLGFGKDKYDQLKEEVTIVQHCAWLLDFNMTIDHYDKECITPFYNLLKFAYRRVNPMHVYFVSSVSASAAYGSTVLEEPLPLDSHICMPMGYAHSKFVVEILLDYLTREKNFPCYIERLGQVCGDSINGVWNISEQYPLMFIGGGSIMHKMPNLDTTIDWIPVDYAAASISDIMLRTAYLSAEKSQYIYHIVNPQNILWRTVLESMKNAGMTFDIISSAEWVKELSKDDSNPAFKLISFYEIIFKEAFKMPVWETKKTRGLTPVLANSSVLDSNLFSKFLTHWESFGFYNTDI